MEAAEEWAASLPPQARGWTWQGNCCHPGKAASPAGAGMDRSSAIPVIRRERFPRRRGDGPPIQPHVVQPRTLPPQARGWTLYRAGIPVQPFAVG